MSNNAITLKDRAAEVTQLLESKRENITAALPAGCPVSAEKVISSAMLAWSLSPYLQDCTPRSLIESVLQAAQLGLEPSGVLGEAYLVPYKGKCQLQIGYQGMITLARRSGDVTDIRARLIHENDEFEWVEGLEPLLRHKPALAGRGKVIGAYAIARLAGGGQHFEVLDIDYLERIRRLSKSKNGPWRDHTDQMRLKTAIRYLFKFLPKSTAAIRQALELDNAEFNFDRVEPTPRRIVPTNVIDMPAPDTTPEDDARRVLAEYGSSHPEAYATAVGDEDPGKWDLARLDVALDAIETAIGA